MSRRIVTKLFSAPLSQGGGVIAQQWRGGYGGICGCLAKVRLWKLVGGVG